MTTTPGTPDPELLPHASRPFNPDGETGVQGFKATKLVTGRAGPPRSCQICKVALLLAASGPSPL